jgi:hypothetical protein
MIGISTAIFKTFNVCKVIFAPMTFNRLFLLFFLTLFIFSCRNDEEFIEDNSAKLEFSTDSISFDTVFTTIGSVTQNFRIYNPHKKAIRINSVRLLGGSNSNFRINIDGLSGNDIKNLEIPAQDSLFAFIEVTINPDNSLNPFVIEDFIEFTTNGNQQRIILTAWGQNAIYYTPTSFNRNLPDFTCLTGPCSDVIAPVDVTWTDSLPIVIYGFIAIDTLDKLTIEAGTKIHFHQGGGMWVYRGGSLTVNGTKQDPVVFRGDRLEPGFEDVPGQWDRIWINEGAINTINYAIIQNAFVGIQAEALFLNGTPIEQGNLRLKNTVIKNCSGIGLLTAYFNIAAENTIITNCGEYNAVIQWLGNWVFDHCTFANYATGTGRETPSVFIKNNYSVGASLFVDPPNVTFRNCIIYGSLDSEFNIEEINNKGSNVSVLNSILKTDENTSDANKYLNILKNPLDEIFKDANASNFELYDISRARNIGSVGVGSLVPFDYNGNDRRIDGLPDAGAYEF